jgi:hypothetical protein
VYPVSSTFLAALRSAHTLSAHVDVYLAGSLVYSKLPFISGEVEVAAGDGVRRKLSLTAPSHDPDGRNLWDVLSPLGTELRPYRGILYPGVATPELVPQGVLGVDAQSLTIGPGGTIAITAPDRWARVQRARFKVPVASVAGALVTAEIIRLVLGAVPGISVTNTATSTEKVGPLVWERDRAQAITDLAISIGAEVFFDWTGSLVIRDAPKLSAAPIPWRVDASPTGVLLSGERSRSKERTYNIVVVASSNVDGSTPFPPQIVADTDPASPTNVAAMGEVPYFYSSPLINSAAAAQKAGRTLLNRVKGVAAQLDVESAVNPALDAGDVFYAVLPDKTIERHLSASFGVPLTLDGTQQIASVSSRPEGDVPNEE